MEKEKNCNGEEKWTWIEKEKNYSRGRKGGQEWKRIRMIMEGRGVDIDGREK